MDNVNIPRSQLVANTFHLFYASAKAALLPFLTLFFRQLGLSATQVGIIIGIRSILSMLFSSVWTSCASSCQKKRTVLMMSVFSAMVMCLLLSLVKPSDPRIERHFCMPIVNSGNYLNDTDNYGIALKTTTATFSTRLPDDHDKIAENNHTKNQLNTSFLSTTTSQPSASKVLGNDVTTTMATSTTLNNEPISKQVTTIPHAVTSKTTISTTTTTATTTRKSTQKLSTTTEILPTTTTKPKPNKKLWDTLSAENKEIFTEFGISEATINEMTEKELEEYVTGILNELNQDEQGGSETGSRRKKRDILRSPLEKLNEQLSQLQEILTTSQNSAFIFVLSIIIIWEVFSCSSEKLADKIWFDFLDGLDLIEKYGSHKAWYVLGFVLVPVCVTALIDNTPCILPHDIHHFNIHFYSFAALMGLAFIWAFMYPILQTNKRIERTTKLLKGMKILFADAQGFSFTFTILLLGLVTAAVDNFMFWMVQDLGGTEMVMGGGVSIAAAVEFVLYVLMKWFLLKVSHVGAVFMGMLLLSMRLVVFSFMWAPYVVLIMAPFHAFTHTLIMGSAENNPDFKINPFIMDRSARSVLHGIYLSVGYASGSVLSGFLYDFIGLTMVFQGAAIMCLVWGILFAIIQKCSKPKRKVRYARLLQAEEDQISDAESMDDDWLEVALKHEK